MGVQVLVELLGGGGGDLVVPDWFLWVVQVVYLSTVLEKALYYAVLLCRRHLHWEEEGVWGRRRDPNAEGRGLAPLANFFEVHSKITPFLAISDVSGNKSMYDNLQIKGFPMQYFWTPELSIFGVQ
jgi:hypothetical protein